MCIMEFNLCRYKNRQNKAIVSYQYHINIFMHIYEYADYKSIKADEEAIML